jgi:glycosyltransferase involved in cell wall biosynthesis
LAAAPAVWARGADMRIVMISDFYDPFVGGVEVAVRNLSRALVERGHDVSVVTARTGDLPAREEDGAILVHRIQYTVERSSRLFSQSRPWAPPVPDPEAVAGISRIVTHAAPDVVHGHDWLARSFLPPRRRRPAFVQSLHYYTLTCAKKSLMFDGVPCSGPVLRKCLGCAGTHYGPVKGAAVALGNYALSALERRRVDLFLPVSEATAIGNGLPRSGTLYEVIPNFIPDRPTVPDDRALGLVDQLPKHEFLLYVGDLRREKGTDVLLQAYAGLMNAPPLVLLGKRWPESPTMMPPNVHVFYDWPNDAVREAQRRCLALVAPPVWPEPFGLVILETLAAGRPVVASRIGGIPDFVTDGQNGLLVTPGDPVELSMALQRLLEDSGLRGRLVAGAAPSTLPFTASEVVPRVIRAYERALSLRKRDHRGSGRYRS